MKDELDSLVELYVDFFDSTLLPLVQIEDSYVCDCDVNYGGRCKYPEKYRTSGCNGED